MGETCFEYDIYLFDSKSKNPQYLRDFRPISLCNVTFKLVNKYITNRLKSLLPNIVYEEQSDFVHRSLITGNNLIGMECFHWLKKKTKGKKGNMALKLDMSKAYGKIECDFVKIMLTSMGFSTSLISVIMVCVTTVSYEILINGQPSRTLLIKRGQRQGDPSVPLSIYTL